MLLYHFPPRRSADGVECRRRRIILPHRRITRTTARMFSITCRRHHAADVLFSVDRSTPILRALNLAPLFFTLTGIARCNVLILCFLRA